ncbi:MAG: nucleoside-diphosphate kinase [Candidatus Hodarchaeales archaeon]
MERTFLMIKPDAVQRGLIGEVIRRIENKGLKIIGLKMCQLDNATAKKLYNVHEGKVFYEGLVNFITSGPVVALAIEGDNSIATVRKMLGSTKSFMAEAGTIRGDFGLITQKNIAHGSDSPERVIYEMGIFFSDEELVDWDRNMDRWIY